MANNLQFSREYDAVDDDSLVYPTYVSVYSVVCVIEDISIIKYVESWNYVRKVKTNPSNANEECIYL